MSRVSLVQKDAKKHLHDLLKRHERELSDGKLGERGKAYIMLEIAFNDVCQLEKNAEDCGMYCGFWETFKNSTSDPGFIPALCMVANYPPNQEAAQPLLDHGLENQGAWVVFHFRELLRNGSTPEDALKRFGKQIGIEIAEGRKWIVSAIYASTQNPPRRSVADWIARAWLPLALWEKVTPPVKRERIKEAAKVGMRIGADLVFLPSSDSALTKAIGTVASKLRKNKR